MQTSLGQKTHRQVPRRLHDRWPRHSRRYEREAVKPLHHDALRRRQSPAHETAFAHSNSLRGVETQSTRIELATRLKDLRSRRRRSRRRPNHPGEQHVEQQHRPQALEAPAYNEGFHHGSEYQPAGTGRPATRPSASDECRPSARPSSCGCDSRAALAIRRPQHLLADRRKSMTGAVSTHWTPWP